MCLGVDKARGRLCGSLRGVGDVSLQPIFPAQSLALLQFSSWEFTSLFRRHLVVSLHSTSHYGTRSSVFRKMSGGDALRFGSPKAFGRLYPSTARGLHGGSWSLDFPVFFRVCNTLPPVSVDGCIPAQSVWSCGWACQQARLLGPKVAAERKSNICSGLLKAHTRGMWQGKKTSVYIS